MSTTVLIFDAHAEIYGAHLRSEFPQLQIVQANAPASVPDDLSNIDVLIAFGITNDLIRRLSRLKWIQSLSSGVDDILRRRSLSALDLMASGRAIASEAIGRKPIIATGRTLAAHFLRPRPLPANVLITTARGVHHGPMREMVVYHMMALSHKAACQVTDQSAHVWDRRSWSLMCGKTAMVVGTGAVGAAIGPLLKAFGMTVIGVTRKPRDLEGFDEVFATESLSQIVHRADYLINVLPATIENFELFGARIFHAMKKTAYFINVGRGQTVDYAALNRCLHEGQLAGAGLDVFDDEPLPAASPLWDLPNVFITPHIGSFVVEFETLVLPLIVHNMRLFLAGREHEMKNLV